MYNSLGLRLEFQISRIAFHIFGMPIYWYAILIVLAMSIAVLFAKKDDGKYGIHFENVVEMLMIAIPISIICARIYYVIFHWERYATDLLQVFQIRRGGLAIYGGIIGAILTSLLYCRCKKINVLDMLDYMIPYLALGQAIGRWGNLMNLEAYGTTATHLFRMRIQENGIPIEVHPTFLYESITCFLIFIILFILKNKRKWKGQLLSIYFICYGIIRFLIEGLRADSLMLGPYRISQIVSILLVIIGTITIFYKRYLLNRSIMIARK